MGVVEQMETPDQLKERNAQKARGVKKEQAVRRELCSIITKGTAFHRDEKSTYLLAVDEDIASRTLGVAFVDAATGHFHLGQVVDDEQHGCLRTLLAQLRPDEIVINEQSLSRDAYTLLRRAVPDGLFNPLPRTAFWADKAACTKALEAGKRKAAMLAARDATLATLADLKKRHVLSVDLYRRVLGPYATKAEEAAEKADKEAKAKEAKDGKKPKTEAKPAAPKADAMETDDADKPPLSSLYAALVEVHSEGVISTATLMAAFAHKLPLM